MNDRLKLPKSWVVARIPDVAQINPRKDGLDLKNEDPVHFVPMAAVGEAFSGVDTSATRPLGEAIKGYTSFQANDVLFAKITPCMENGKIAVVPRLEHKWGFGSTEFHVLRASVAVLPEWIAHFLFQEQVRREAQRSMTGSAGQLRVPAKWLTDQAIPIPPLNEQRRIVQKIEELFSKLDAGVAALERVQANLKRYRAAVLKAAVEGKLTAEWRVDAASRRVASEETRQDAASTYEPASKLLDRILKERRRKWEEAQLAKYAAAGKEPPKGWREKYQEPPLSIGQEGQALPVNWILVCVDHLLTEPTCNGISVKGSDRPPGVAALRLSAMSAKGFNYNERRYIQIDAETASALSIREDDFFVSRGNGSLHLVGRGTLAQAPPDRVVFPDTMIRLRLSNWKQLRRYVSLAWQSRVIRGQIEKKARTTAGIYKISQRDIESFWLPLPPLAEQDQIVAEVERRLSIVDELETQVAADLKRAGRLRQSILKRAFAGRLVPQDPNDEPAVKLLERIKAARREASEPVAGRPRRTSRRAGS